MLESTVCLSVHAWLCGVSHCTCSVTPLSSYPGLALYCSSKILTQDKEHFARLAVDAVLRLKGSSNLESIHIIKKTGGTLKVGALLVPLLQ